MIELRLVFAAYFEGYFYRSSYGPRIDFKAI